MRCNPTEKCWSNRPAAILLLKRARFGTNNLLHSYAEFLTGQGASRLNGQREVRIGEEKKGLIGLSEERREDFLRKVTGP